MASAGPTVRDRNASNMSSATANRPTYCKFYANNCCRQGDRCHFSHDERTAVVDNACRYYLLGHCAYGSRCRYDHVRPPRGDSNTNATRSTATTLPSTNSSASKKTAPVMPSSTTDAQLPPLNPNAAVFVPTAHRHLSPPNNSSALSAILAVSASSPYAVADMDARTGVAIPMTELTFSANKFSSSDQSYSRVVAQCGSVVDEGNASVPCKKDSHEMIVEDDPSTIFCPYNLLGQCYYGSNCAFVHGEVCDMCQQPLLHPTDGNLRAQHKKECLSEHEEAMEAAFAEQRTVEKQCGICMEQIIVRDNGHKTHKKDNEPPRRFGILPNCKHVFCLECIRKWRRSSQFENQIIRACPECRVKSDFVVPSSRWMETEAEKEQLINGYKQSLGKQHCKYFARGKSLQSDTADECPFGNRCFYRHELPDGTKVAGDSPAVVRRRMQEKMRRGRKRGDGYRIWDFMANRTVGGGLFAFSDTHSGSSISFDDDDLDPEEQFRQMVDFNMHMNGLGWSSDDEDDDEDPQSSDEDNWLMRTLQEELRFLTFRGNSHSRRSTTAAVGGSTSSAAGASSLAPSLASSSIA